MVAAASLQWSWRCQVENGRQLISCAVFLKFKLGPCKLNVWASNSHFSSSTPWAAWGIVAGRMWPAGRTLCITDLECLRHYPCPCSLQYQLHHHLHHQHHCLCKVLQLCYSFHLICLLRLIMTSLEQCPVSHCLSFWHACKHRCLHCNCCFCS